MVILVINAGSSSLKYQLIRMDDEKLLAKGLCERIGIDGHIRGKTFSGVKFSYDVTLDSHTSAFTEVKKVLTHGETKVIESLDEIHAVGHRIVQGGSLFHESVIVDKAVEDGIESLCEVAPLHNAAHLQGIRAAEEVFGPKTPQVAVFDNAFHATMPPRAYMFGLPYEYYEKYKVRRYGFHGTSHRFITGRYKEITGKEDFKIITCHLGNGSSLAAIKNGEVIDTTMGFTPLDGFMMGSRCGGVDPSAITYIQRKENLSPDETAQMMNKKSGLLGISGVSSDMRDVQRAADSGNERAILALEMLYYQIRKYIGSFIAALDGTDAIIFTGGIGENCIPLRKDICDNLSSFGVKLDDNLNLDQGEEIKISSPDSKIDIWVIPTDEELLIARDTLELTT